jgi:hypothetical protein
MGRARRSATRCPAGQRARNRTRARGARPASIRSRTWASADPTHARFVRRHCGRHCPHQTADSQHHRGGAATVRPRQGDGRRRRPRPAVSTATSSPKQREAVTRDWLDRVHTGLHEISTSDMPAPERLRQWLQSLFEAKKKHARDDPDLFRSLHGTRRRARRVRRRACSGLDPPGQAIIVAGIERGEFADTDAGAAADGVFAATFHNPLHAPEWSGSDIDAKFRDVTNLVSAGSNRQR